VFTNFADGVKFYHALSAHPIDMKIEGEAINSTNKINAGSYDVMTK
jgi:hypothetical protein